VRQSRRHSGQNCEHWGSEQLLIGDRSRCDGTAQKGEAERLKRVAPTVASRRLRPAPANEAVLESGPPRWRSALDSMGEKSAVPASAGIDANARPRSRERPSSPEESHLPLASDLHGRCGAVYFSRAIHNASAAIARPIAMRQVGLPAYPWQALTKPRMRSAYGFHRFCHSFHIFGVLRVNCRRSFNQRRLAPRGILCRQARVEQCAIG